MSSKSNSVVLRYYGHSAFQWTTPRGARILVDPFHNPPMDRPRWFLREFPQVPADLVVVSHPHFDHDALERVKGYPSIISTPGKFTGRDFTVETVPDRHARDYGAPFHHLNLVIIVRVAGIIFCHLGDNRAGLSVEVRKRIGPVDILMVSIDASYHLLTYDEVDAVIKLLEPTVVIPMHYLIPGLTDPDSTLETAESWIESQTRVRRIPDGEVKVTSSVLPESREVWVFDEYAKE